MQGQKIQKKHGKNMDIALGVYVLCVILSSTVTDAIKTGTADYWGVLLLELCCVIQFFILLKKTLKLHSYFLFPFTFVFPLILIFTDMILKINVPEFLGIIVLGLTFLKMYLILDIIGLFILCINDKNQIMNVSKNFLIRIPLLVGCAVLFFLGLYPCNGLSFLGLSVSNGWGCAVGGPISVASALLFYLFFPKRNFSWKNVWLPYYKKSKSFLLSLSQKKLFLLILLLLLLIFGWVVL